MLSRGCRVGGEEVLRGGGKWWQNEVAGGRAGGGGAWQRRGRAAGRGDGEGWARGMTIWDVALPTRKAKVLKFLEKFEIFSAGGCHEKVKK